MTKFEDQLYDDLMRAHGHALARTTVPASPKHRVTRRRTLLAAGGALAAAAAIAGTLVAGGGTPAYAVTKNPDGSVTVAVYQESGIAGANARLKQLGDSQVVVVPIVAGCPAPKAPAVSPKGHRISMGGSASKDGSVTFTATGIPAGDIVVVGTEATGHSRFTEAVITSPPAPTCIAPSA
jgi:hypothetical protein